MLATASARSGVMVGTWPQLLARAQAAYSTTAPPDSSGGFSRALARFDSAFWSASLSSAREETTAAVRGALVQLLAATDPRLGWAAIDLGSLPYRTGRIVQDLLSLAKATDRRLPGDLAPMLGLLEADVSEAIHLIRVHRVRGLPHTNRWQDKLIRRLNLDACEATGTTSSNGGFAGLLDSCLLGVPRADPGSALHELQTRLFETDDKPVSTDPSLQWIRVRDYYEEAEVAAGMVRELLAADHRLRPSDTGLLVPEGFEYDIALEDAFRLAGLPLSRIADERQERDLGYETVFQFLFCRDSPAPAMARAACLASPLMPWCLAEGAELAQRVMDGLGRHRPRDGASDETRVMLDLLAGGDTGPRTLSDALLTFAATLTGGETLDSHLERAKEAVARLRARLEGAESIDWVGLRRLVTPQAALARPGTGSNLEGVTVWGEREEPWRDVRHLLVLGFTYGRYPRRPASSAVFSESDIGAIRRGIGVALEAPSDRQDRWRKLFRRQLRACPLYTSPSPRDGLLTRMPSSA